MSDYYPDDPDVIAGTAEDAERFWKELEAEVRTWRPCAPEPDGWVLPEPLV